MAKKGISVYSDYDRAGRWHIVIEKRRGETVKLSDIIGGE